MVTMGNRSDGNPVLLKADNTVFYPTRIPFEERRFEEGWLQRLIERNPGLLPVEDIEPVFAPLIPIGTEVGTDAGPIDNLFISPAGYLTIVETKLWRNPEARRQVVGQIVDYAKDISHWSFEKLDMQVRNYNRRHQSLENGILETIRFTKDSQMIGEAKLVDTISRNLERGRLLLLIVGDGIRESVEAMVEFLTRTPQLQFTLALVELQVYEIKTGEAKDLLVIPQVVTRTREITRAVVHIEGVDIQSVRVDVDTSTAGDVAGSRRRTISEQDYFNALGQSLSPDQVEFAQQIIRDMEDLGCLIQWRQASYVVRLADPSGSGQKLTLFVVTKDGQVYVGWLPGQLKNIGLPQEIGYEFVEESSKPFKGCRVHPTNRESWAKSISLGQLHERYEDFVLLVERTIVRIRSASAKAEG